MIGTTLSQYRITASIGAGGMGEVFRARDTRLNRDVAIKVLPKDFASDADRLRRFEQEAKTLAALNHPNVLTIHDAGVHEGAPYLVSESLEGRTLREETNGGALPMRKATDYALQIAQGLAAAHGKGIIHRDLKPENIFITKDRLVKILDFGLAKPKENPKPADPDAETLLHSTIKETTEPGKVMGTPAYMSPEQVRGEPADHRADIFAFGCVLYEMLSGTRAFRRDTPVESMNAVLNDTPPELNTAKQAIPPSLARIVERCLEKQPDKRFQTAKDLTFAIETASNTGRVAPVGRERDASVVSRRWRLVFGIAVVVLILAGIGRWLVQQSGKALKRVAQSSTNLPPAAPMTAEQKSIAVLPFTDMSEKMDQDFLADGMAEEIMNLLAKAPDLLVSARTSSFFFKGKQTKIPEIARELGVAHVLEGSIRRSGDRLRVTAKLVRADNGYHLWSETYDRELRDVFKVQDDIANAVVQALQIRLMGGQLSRQKGGTQNLEAYQLYLHAMSDLNQNTKESLDAAGVSLEQAIKLDPGYGMAWYAPATVVSVKTDNAWLPPMEGWERVRQLAQHALQLSPDLAEAHARLQWAHMSLDWNWPAAEAEGRRALAIDPMNPSALMAAGRLSATLGRWDDSERQLRAALVRDRLNPYLIWNLGFTHYRAGRFGESESLYRRLLELEPGFLWTRTYLGKTLLARGKPDAALAMVQQEADEATRLWFLPIMLQAAGRQAEADEALQAQIAQWSDTGAFFVAMTYAYRGDHDRALEWLERAYQQKDASLDEIVGEPLFKNIADDPRFRKFLRKMNLPE